MNNKEEGNNVKPITNIENHLGAILVTGAYGFIGSCLVSYLNQKGFENLILVDEFNDEKKALNLLQKKYLVKVERENLFEWLQNDKHSISFVFHLGARTDTTEFDYSIHQKLNVDYSQKIWNYCSQNKIPLIYASSAATYGKGELGYTDNHSICNILKPLNPYGISKNEFDKWALLQEQCPPFWAGLKFFNVYGPNEYHKGRMASVIFHTYNQIAKNGKMKLFKSNDSFYKDGEQLRDFVYVKDLCNVMLWMKQYHNSIANGLYNLGTGKARTFNDLVNATFSALNLKANIEYIEMPEDLKETYQNFTEANMQKSIAAGYPTPFHTLEEGVNDYVQNYLSTKQFL